MVGESPHRQQEKPHLDRKHSVLSGERGSVASHPDPTASCPTGLLPAARLEVHLPVRTASLGGPNPCGRPRHVGAICIKNNQEETRMETMLDLETRTWKPCWTLLSQGLGNHVGLCSVKAPSICVRINSSMLSGLVEMV